MHKDRLRLKEAGFEDLEIVEPEEHPVKRVFKKTYIISVALLLIVLLMVNTNAGYHIINLVSGNLVSSRFEDYVFTISDSKRVVFTNETWESLLTIYRANEQHEFAVCLKGTINDGTYNIDELYSPTIFKQDVYSVTSEECQDTIIALHSHPPLQCLFSEQDIKSYEIFKQRNPDAMFALMCSENMISFYPGK